MHCRTTSFFCPSSFPPFFFFLPPTPSTRASLKHQQFDLFPFPSSPFFLFCRGDQLQAVVAPLPSFFSFFAFSCPRNVRRTGKPFLLLRKTPDLVRSFLSFFFSFSPPASQNTAGDRRLSEDRPLFLLSWKLLEGVLKSLHFLPLSLLSISFLPLTYFSSPLSKIMLLTRCSIPPPSLLFSLFFLRQPCRVV